MSDRPHNLLVEHFRVENPATHGDLIDGVARGGCLACDEIERERISPAESFVQRWEPSDG